MFAVKILTFFMVIISVSSQPLLFRGNNENFRTQDESGNYYFGYTENGIGGGSFRTESGDNAGVKRGSYGIRNEDGRLRIVNYIADGEGFRADVQSNEPGVGVQNVNTETAIVHGTDHHLKTRPSSFHQIHGNYVLSHGGILHPHCCAMLYNYVQHTLAAL